MNTKFLAASVAACALAVTPVALASGGAAATATPSHQKQGKNVVIKVVGMKPKEKVKVTELIVSNGQRRTIYTRAGAGGVLIDTVKAQVKGRHVWTFTGRSSHRKATTHYVVR